MTPRNTAAAATLALLLSACGGEGAPPPVQTITGSSTATAGDARTGAAVLVLALPGPVLELAAPATVHVTISGSAELHAHYAADGTLDVRLAAPVPTGASATATRLHHFAPAQVAVAYSVTVALPAGTHELMASVTARATDLQGRATGALSTAQATVDWLVEVQP